MPVNVKPTSTPPAWDTNATNLSVPSAGQQASGWTVGQTAVSAWMNWWQNLAYLWLLFVSFLFTDGGQAAGNMDLGATAETNLVPLTKYRDFQQNTRASIDHNGYRMGQVSEMDETWMGGSSSFQVSVSPLGVGSSTTSKWDFTNGLMWLLNANDVLEIPLSQVPAGGLITSAVVYVRTTSGSAQSATLAVLRIPLSAPSNVQIVEKDVSVTNATVSTDIMASPTNGWGPVYVDPTQHMLFVFSAKAGNTATMGIVGATLTYTADPAGWTWTGVLANNGTGTASPDQRGYKDAQGGQVWPGQRCLQLTSGANGGSDGGSTLVSAWETGWTTDTLVVMETAIAATGFDTHSIADVGFELGTASNLVTLRYDPAKANWQLWTQWAFASTAEYDTGVAFANSTIFRVRLELYGANRTGSATTRAKLYINGSKVQDQTIASLVATDKLRTRLNVRTTGATGGPYNLYVGRLRRVFNHFASGDNL